MVLMKMHENDFSHRNMCEVVLMWPTRSAATRAEVSGVIA
jgi:hypothetical protein